MQIQPTALQMSSEYQEGMVLRSKKTVPHIHFPTRAQKSKIVVIQSPQLQQPQLSISQDSHNQARKVVDISCSPMREGLGLTLQESSALFTLPSQLSVMKRNPEKGDRLKPRVTEPGKATEPGVTGGNVTAKVNKAPGGNEVNHLTKR